MSSVSSGGKVVGRTPVAQVRYAILQATYVTLTLDLLFKRGGKLGSRHVINLGLALQQRSGHLGFELSLFNASPLHNRATLHRELDVIAGGGR